MNIALLAAALSAAPARAASQADAVKAVDAALDDWHDAAAKADEARYFGHFAKEAVFLGTDATERWTVGQFRAYAHPRFASGKAWTLTPSGRHVTVEPDGDAAWFDETVVSPSYGPSRGTGVLVLEDGAWKVAQYSLSVPIPNDLLMKVAGMIRAESAPADFRDVTPKEAAALIEARRTDPSFQVLDVRTPAEAAAGRIHGSMNVDYTDPGFKDKLAKLDKSKTYVVHCAVGGRSAKAQAEMRELGFRSVLNMKGGLKAWQAEGLPTEKKP